MRRRGDGVPREFLRESFLKRLKREEVYLHDYRTFEEVEANLSRFIEAVDRGPASAH